MAARKAAKEAGSPSKSSTKVEDKQNGAQNGDVAPKKDDERKLREAYLEMRAHVRYIAVLQLFYILWRTFWHEGIPWLLGSMPFVPFVKEIAAGELAVFLLFWLAGGLGRRPERERHLLLNAYNLLALVLVAKCVLDTYIMNFSPDLWAHYHPSTPQYAWGIPTLLSRHTPQLLRSRGLTPDLAERLLTFFERMVDTACLTYCFRLVRAGKVALQTRRVLRKMEKAAQQKKDD